MPHYVPILAIQAPELLGIKSFANISERVNFYRDLLISELADYNPCIHIVGGSMGGLFAYGLAQSMKGTRLLCAALYLVDPPPLARPKVKPQQKSDLITRAKALDIVCGAFLNTKTSFLQGVELNDIICMGDLEMHLSQCSARAHELSCIADMVARNFV